MSLLIELQNQVHQSTFDNLLLGSGSPVLGEFKGIPTGTFTNLEGPVTPFSLNPTAFRITTDFPGETHTIEAELISNATNSNSLNTRSRLLKQTFIPSNNVATVFIPLLKGINQVTVSTVNDINFTTVNVTHYGTFLTAYARDIFSSTQNPLNEQTRALFSKFSSRIPEILIPFQDLYPDPKSLRTLVSRFVTRAFMTGSGSTDGVRDFMSALMGTTPYFIQTKTDQNIFEPDVVPIFRSQLEFGGYEAHTWIPNFEIIHWLAFVRLINNARNFYKIEEIGEKEILISAGGEPESHRFDFDDPSATAYREFNVTDFKIIIQILSKTNIRLCAAGYTFDLYVTESNPLGTKRIALDSGIPLDSGESFDAPSIDPGDDGWVGLPLAGRFDSSSVSRDLLQLSLDSLFITPNESSNLPECAYDGFFTQQIYTVSGEMDVDANVGASGNLSDPLDNLSLESFEVDTTVEDFSNISEWALTGSPGGSIEASAKIALAGASSVLFKQPATGSSPVPIISKSYSTPLNISQAGGKILYFSVFLGPEAMPDNVKNIPSHPGNLLSLSVALTDSNGNKREYTFFKEDLKRGVNTLPLMLEFPSRFSGNNSAWNASRITQIEIIPRPIFNTLGWSDVYLGRLHVFNSQAYFRPARAKIEFESVENVSPDSLLGSSIVFTDHLGNTQSFVGDSTYNTIDRELGTTVPDTAYRPGFYKIQSDAGVGFNRLVTALNLQRELGRQLENKSHIITVPQLTSGLLGADEEVAVNVFSKEFSPAGNERNLKLENPNGSLDLIDFTGFSGGTVGLHEKLIGVPGFSLAQRFTSSTQISPKFIELFLYRIGEPAGELTVSIHEDRFGRPGRLLARTEDVTVYLITNGIPNYTIFNVLGTLNLTSSTNYWILLSGNSIYFEGLTSPVTLKKADIKNHIIWSKQVGGFSNPRAKTDPNLIFKPSGFWDVEPNEHHYFRIIG